MTVASTYTAPQYTGNGATTAFSFPYNFFAKSDLVVTLFDTTANAAVTPAPVLNGAGTYDYAVSGTQDTDTGEYLSGGSVTFNTAPPGNYQVTIQRSVAATQNVSLTNNAPFPAKTIEGSLDRLTMLVQQASAALNRVLTIPASDTGVPITLPSKATRANQLLGFDANGAPIAASASGSAVSLPMQPVVSASSTAAAMTAMGALPRVATTPTGQFTVATTNTGTSGSTTGSSSSAGFVQIADSSWAPPGNLSQHQNYFSLGISQISLSSRGTVAQLWNTQNQIFEIAAVTSAGMAGSHTNALEVFLEIPSGVGDGGGGAFSGGLPTNPNYQEIGGLGFYGNALSPGHYIEGISSYVNDNTGGAGVENRLVSFISVMSKNAAGNAYAQYGYQAVSVGTATGVNAPSAAFVVNGPWLVSLDLSGNTNTAVNRTDIRLPNNTTINAGIADNTLNFGVAGNGVLTLGTTYMQLKGMIVVDQMTAPGTPAAGTFLIYQDNADGKLKAKGPSGTVTVLAVP